MQHPRNKNIQRPERPQNTTKVDNGTILSLVKTDSSSSKQVKSPFYTAFSRWLLCALSPSFAICVTCTKAAWGSVSMHLSSNSRESIRAASRETCVCVHIVLPMQECSSNCQVYICGCSCPAYHSCLEDSSSSPCHVTNKSHENCLLLY